MFRRYAIVGERDREQAVLQLEAARAAQLEQAKADAKGDSAPISAPIEQTGAAAAVAARTNKLQ